MHFEKISYKDNIELNYSIKDLQKSINHQIKQLRKRIISPGDVQLYERKNTSLTEVEKIENNVEHLVSRSKEILYNENSNLTLPISSAKIYRFIHLRNFVQILESLDRAINRKNPIEICFHLRSYIEHSANFLYALDEIIPLAQQLFNNIQLELKPNVYSKELQYFVPKEYVDSLTKLYQIFIYSCFQRNVLGYYQKGHGEFIGNDSIELDKTHGLKSVKISKKLKAFEEKVDSIHPTYDLLSEFLHPNSFTFNSSFLSPGKQKSNIIINDQKIEDSLHNIEHFFGEKNRLLFEAITFEILKGNSELLSLQGKIAKKTKESIKKRLSFYDYKSDSAYAKKPCACGSKKLLIACCAK
jgi:hypothetical protein